MKLDIYILETNGEAILALDIKDTQNPKISKIKNFHVSYNSNKYKINKGACFEIVLTTLCQQIRLYLNILAKLTPFFEDDEIKVSSNRIYKIIRKIYKNTK